MIQGRNPHQLLIELLESCKSKDFAGYSKFDALNSPLLEVLSFKNRYLRLFFIQAVKECPFHIRPFLGVRKSRNPKGIALFTRAYLNLFEMTGEASYLEQAKSLLRWLLDNPSPKNDKLCWGYNFIWTSQIFGLERYEPNAVVTVFAAEALLHAFRLTGSDEYLNAALSAGSWLINDLAVLHDEGDERAVSYVRDRAARIVLNTQVLTGAVYIKLFHITKDDKWLDTAVRQYNFVARRTIKDCTWNYSFPPERYHAVDNYHTGGILDSLLEFYEETGNDVYNKLYWRGLDYYRDHLFEPDGAPKWMDNRSYPYDIHGAAQGIISFVKASYHKEEYLKVADRIFNWTVANMYSPARREFIYRIGRLMRWNYSLMRWCNGWMSKAISDLDKRHASLAGGMEDDRKRVSVR